VGGFFLLNNYIFHYYQIMNDSAHSSTSLKKNTFTFFLSLITIFINPSCSKIKNTVQSQISSKAPNVLLIVVDDLGYHDLSHTGSNYYETPNIDKLAKNSMEFTQAYSSSPVCSPARASIMTGQFPSRHGITDWIGAFTGEAWRKQGRQNKMLPAANKKGLSTNHISLAKALKQNGYSTFIAGKWHLGGEGSTPEEHGFDINVGAWDVGSPRGGYYDPYENPKLGNRKIGESLTMRLADETVHFFKKHTSENSEKPFFAFLSFYAVHSPLQTTNEKWKKYRNKADSIGIAETGFKMGAYLPVRQHQDHPIYGGLVETMDEALAYVLNGLKEQHLEENTIIIFTSDNGGVSSGDHFSTSNLPLRGGKGSTFEGGIRVPFFVYVPGLTKAGSTSNTPISMVDIYPSLLELSGNELLPEQHKDGESFVALLHGKPIPERALIWHYPHYSNQDGRPSSAIRLGEWKLIYDYETQKKELYHLKNDGAEFHNVASTFPEKADELYAQLMNHLTDTGALFPQIDPQYNHEKELEYLEKVRTKRVMNLEAERLRFLSPDFNPGNKWWESDIN